MLGGLAEGEPNSIGGWRFMIVPNLAARFGENPRVASLSWRSKAIWLLGYPEAALADIDQTLKDARKLIRSLAVAVRRSFSSIATVKIRRQQMPG
jgi:hypothetical protein